MYSGSFPVARRRRTIAPQVAATPDSPAPAGSDAESSTMMSFISGGVFHCRV